METMNLNGIQVIVQPQSGLQNGQRINSSMKPRYAKQLIGLGKVHILIGVFCIIFQSIGLEKFANGGNILFSYIGICGHGLWGGLLFFVTGIIGITAGTRKSNCQVVAFNILSIVSTAIACLLTILAAISVFTILHPPPWECHLYNKKSYSVCTTDTYLKIKIILVMDSLLIAMGILEGIIALWSSIVCCLIGACSCCQVYAPQMQPMILSGEQQAALMSNPMFMTNQQQSTAGFCPQQVAATVEGFYTGLNTGMRYNLSRAGMDASVAITTSIYEELHDYEEIEQPSKF